MNRRNLLRIGAAAVPGYLLSACTGIDLSRNQSPRASLFPVNVARDRLIRVTVGLRPYRASGFVVRADPFEGKRLVHNYGHGGAGITLSWGTSHLATRIGLQGHGARDGPIAVIGAGVVGLSTARLVQEAGLPVTVYAAALPPETTSNVSGGQWHPFGHFRDDAVTDAWRAQFVAAADFSWRRFQLMVGDDYGIRWLTTYAEGEPEDRLLPTFPPAMRALARHEHPFPADEVYRFDTMYVEVGRYLRQLMRDIVADGGRIVVRRFAAMADIATLAERVVFNCTGLGARELVGDNDLKPIRGQLAVLLPQPEIDYAYTLGAGYMFPRRDGIILGGTFERDDWSLEPREATTERIVKSHAAVSDALRRR